MPRNSSDALEPGACGLGAGGGDGAWDGELGNLTLRCWLQLLSLESGADLHGDGASGALRAAIALTYAAVCLLGLLGNALALHLLRSRHRHRSQSSITRLVMGLAVTDLQFVLTLPFWAVDTALDFRWPFGRLMCKIVGTVTAMNMYASVFFLTAMSVARYCALASALRAPSPRRAAGRARWASLGIWVLALAASLPHAVYSTTVRLSDEELCLVRFPDAGRWDPQLLLGLYQTQKVLLGFLAPLAVICVCYLLLLRFVLRRHAVGAPGPAGEPGCHRRRSKVTRSVTVVVLSFFLCWLPNQALTLWGVLIKFDLVPFSAAFYNAQAYAFPLSVCLAHTNSCLNPVLYCLVRQEFRAGLKEILLRATPSFRNLGNLATRKKDAAQPEPVLVLA
ncbi:relaxin-3 receptor 1-like [Conger conger]|uniref:relaxin-3 receptor 1-like n=1 Tax=Conger conger TaxID=82655 RepID=UPI002A59E45F|nr:relaxin-3 receptor 1-like [Conger conger]